CPPAAAGGCYGAWRHRFSRQQGFPAPATRASPDGRGAPPPPAGAASGRAAYAAPEHPAPPRSGRPRQPVPAPCQPRQQPSFPAASACSSTCILLYLEIELVGDKLYFFAIEKCREAQSAALYLRGRAPRPERVGGRGGAVHL